MRAFVVLCVVAGCGSSAKQPADPKDAARAAAERRDKEIAAMKPASPYALRERLAYRPTDRCGQGPYRLETDSLGVKYGERLVVYACGKHAISGNYRLTTTRKRIAPDVDESAFGFGQRDNAACKVRGGTVTSTGPGGGGGSATKASGTASGATGTTAAAPATIKPVALERATSAVPEDCVRTHVLDHGYSTEGDYVAIEGHWSIDVWSDEPNDLDGLVFVIEKHAVVADMTPERWTAYREANDRWYEAYRAHLDEELRAGRAELVDNKVKTPPPPPPRAELQPPKPSQNARWIPGYWVYEEAKFHWIAGLWDVPQEDIQRELTVEAPKPPPAAPPVQEDRPVEPQPTKTAVWTPGTWYWNGTTYVWVQGAWRIPPDPRHTWQPPTWNVRRGRAVFVPGGWRVRVRLGH